jgi:hypothetical protein
MLQVQLHPSPKGATRMAESAAKLSIIFQITLLKGGKKIKNELF